MAEFYVKAVHDFNASRPNELSLRIGDLAEVTEIIDDNWFQGVVRKQAGNFPSAFVKLLKLPATLHEHERVFVAIGNFDGGEQGDLCFLKGDIVIGTAAVDANWWEGRLETCQTIGIFPLTHVEEVRNRGHRSTNQNALSQARVVASLAAQLDGELDLREGEIVEILKYLDDGFAVGRCAGKVGQFPLSFVEITDATETQSLFSSESRTSATRGQPDLNLSSTARFQPDLNPSSTSRVQPDLNPSLTSRVQPDLNPSSNARVQPDLNPSSNARGQPDYDISSTNGCYGSSSTLGNDGAGQAVTKKGHSRKGSYTQANTRSHDSFVRPYGQTLFPFVGVDETEISFGANEIVTLVSHVDDDWVEGEINGRRGIFPTSYVNIIVDCQPAATGDENGAKDAAKNVESYGRVLYNFAAETKEELDLVEGDTVTIIDRLNADWYRVKHDDDRIGLCPSSYVEVFVCEPLLEPATTPIVVDRGQSSTAADRGQLSTSIDNSPRLRAGSAGNRPKPAIKPKPKAESTTTSPAHVGVNIDKTSPSVDVCRSVDDGQPSQRLSKIVAFQKRPTNMQMSLDEVIRNEVKKMSDKTENRNSKFGDSSVVDSSPSKTRSMSFADGGVGQIRKLRESASASPAVSMATKHPQLTPRPISLDVCGGGGTDSDVSPFSSESKFPKVKRKPPPPLPVRPFGAKEPEVAKSGISKFIPKRPAPPCPSSATLRNTLPRVARSDNDLMMFSPDQNNTGIDVLHLSSSSPGFDPEATDMNSPSKNKSSVADTEPDREKKAMAEKMKDKRRRILDELLQTETDYVNSLVLCLKTFSGAKQCPPALDLDLLFGNADEVVELSQSLLSSLEPNILGKPFEAQTVGRYFIDLKDRFRCVYAPYCRNHDSVIALLEKHESNSEISDFFQLMLKQMRQHSSVFDLSSVLIKPVQRILKYPLLLSELEKSTEESHVDKRHLAIAVGVMTDTASYINEYKRRKDLVLKYKKETDIKFSDKMSRLSMHSTMKKLYRISQKMVGIQTVDDRFNHEEQRFRALDSSIRNLVRDVSRYIEQNQESVECRELISIDILDFYSEQSTDHEIEKFSQVHGEILRTCFYNFKDQLESEILPPLNSLLLMFQGPNKVIRKRYDKLLDFDNASARLKSLGDNEQAKAQTREELNVAKINYEALNCQLLDDLPKLCDLSMDIVMSCLHRLLRLNELFHQQALDKLHDLFGLQLVLTSKTSGNVIEAFNIDHAIAVERLSDMSFIPKTFNPQAEQVRKMKERRSTLGGGGSHALVDIDIGSDQCDGQRVYLRQIYAANRLFWVNKDFKGAQVLDLDLPNGTLVGVIKEGDPMGNKDRWFVDNGANKGFITKDFLSSYEMRQRDAFSSSGSVSHDLLDLSAPSTANSGGSSSRPKSTSHLENSVFSPLSTDIAHPLTAKTTTTSKATAAAATTTSKAATSKDWIKFTDEPNQLNRISSSSSSLSVYNTSQDLYRAVYAFNSRSNNELTVAEGQVVRIIEKRDLDGNDEWWKAETEDGRIGYVPANYLYSIL